MLSSLFFVKLTAAVAVVVVLSIIAEHASPRIAGILSGYPTGSAIALFFFGLELGKEFAAESAVYNMVGMVATQSFVYFYYRGSLISGKSNILTSSVAAIAGYFIVIYLLHLIKLNKFITVLIPLVSIPIFIYLFRKVQDIQIENKVNLNRGVILLRALFAASIILVVTGVAKFVGSTWAGLFSAFPTTVYPLLLIVHANYGKNPAHTICKNLPVGIGSVALYSLTVSIAYPLYGTYMGTIISFAVATAYLAIFHQVHGKMQNNTKEKAF